MTKVEIMPNHCSNTVYIPIDLPPSQCNIFLKKHAGSSISFSIISANDSQPYNKIDSLCVLHIKCNRPFTAQTFLQNTSSLPVRIRVVESGECREWKWAASQSFNCEYSEKDQLLAALRTIKNHYRL